MPANPPPMAPSTTIVRAPLVRRMGFSLPALLVTTTLSVFAYAQTKVAVVDTQRAMMETEEGLRMQANIKKIFDTKQKQLEVKQSELEQERADIEKQQGVISEAALRKRAENWQREMMALQQMSVTYNQELQSTQAEMTQPIIQKTMQLIRRIATQEGYDMVVDKQAVPYARADLDLTDRVIMLYNGGGDAAAAPKQAGDKAADPAKKPDSK